MTHRRFYSAMILFEILQNSNPSLICEKFHIHTGILQNLRLNSISACGITSNILTRLGWSGIAAVFVGLKDRLKKCSEIPVELQDLCLLSSVQPRLAKELVRRGISTVEDLGKAEVHQIYDAQEIFYRSEVASTVEDKQFLSNQDKRRWRFSEYILSEAQSLIEERIHMLEVEKDQYKDENAEDEEDEEDEDDIEDDIETTQVDKNESIHSSDLEDLPSWSQMSYETH